MVLKVGRLLQCQIMKRIYIYYSLFSLKYNGYATLTESPQYFGIVVFHIPILNNTIKLVVMTFAIILSGER